MKLKNVKEVAWASVLDLVCIYSADSFEGYRCNDSVMRDPKLVLDDASSLVIVGECDLKKLKMPEEGKLIGYIARNYADGHEYNLVDELLPIKKLLEEHGYKAQISPGSLALSSFRKN